ncbi:MAG: hypothetical protein P9M03_00970 [Candidatus Theseobacter exili]|nr:hypothetical protein [Candidatus Theseobacter exili]
MTEKFEIFVDDYRYVIEPVPDELEGKWLANVTVTKYRGLDLCSEPFSTKSGPVYATKDIAIDESIDLAKKAIKENWLN